jgi:glycosyltransferase involved in cell wall biosynthesis
MLLSESANLMMVGEDKQGIALAPVRLAPLGETPLVSVLVANYNYEKYIGHTIESVLGQTYSNWELIICDDGSKDRSVEIIERYLHADRRIRLLRKENGGHGSALNAAYAASRGGILCLLDSDDVFLPHKIERVVDCCRREANAGFVVHRVIRVNQNGRRQGVWPMSDALPEGWYGASLLEMGGVLANLPPTSGISLRREVAEVLFPMPVVKPLAGCPDQVIMRLAPLVTPVAKTDEPLSEYRLHSTNSYGSQRITAEFVSREISVCRSLWRAQYEFLEQRSEALAAQLKPVESSFFLVYLGYLEARLSGHPSARARHAVMMERLRKQPDARFVKFWEWSIHLPLFAFDFAVNLMSRQSALKQVLARLKGLV